MGKAIAGIAWTAKNVRGTTYDLSHLHPHLWEVTIPADAKNPEMILKVNVTYGLHCFARSPNQGEQVDPELTYSDSRETRVFCDVRWELSKQLPAIISTLGERRVMHTGREEFVTLEIIHQGKTIEYAVFFTVTKAAKVEGVHLNLFVNSAHERYDPLRYPKPIKFKFILLNRYQGKEIKVPR